MGMMHGMHSKISGLMLAVSGAALFAFGMGWVGGMLGYQVAGGLLFLVGLAWLMHAMGMCKQCEMAVKKK